ncbi:MAG: YkgJ family cysteine cluster protein [Candidatus Bilamarchaeaceae archaeon]
MLSPCLFCSAECCKNLYITVTIFDVIRIAEKTGKKPDEFAVLYPLKLINFDNDTVLELYDRKYPAEHILCLKSHPCIFLKGTSCTIHDFAPSACKTFPKKIGGGFSGFCPFPASLLFRVLGTNMPVNYANELSAYREIVASWNRKKGKKKDCMKFLIQHAKDSSALSSAGTGSRRGYGPDSESIS